MISAARLYAALKDIKDTYTFAEAVEADVVAATARLDDIVDDDVLSQDEKPQIILDYDTIIADQPGLDAEADKYGITTEKTNYDNAITALTTYLATLTTPVLWSNLAGVTDIAPGTTFRNNFETVYTYMQTLSNAIYSAAKDLADAAKEVADKKIQTFYEDLASIPTSESIGDLWVETDNSNKLYRAASIGADQITAGEWETVQDQIILANQAEINEMFADGYITPVEKVILYRLWSQLVEDKPAVLAIADQVGILSSNAKYVAFVAAYDALDYFFNTDPDLFDDLTVTTATSNATLSGLVADYNDTRGDLLTITNETYIVGFPSDDGLLAHYSLDDGQGVGGAIATYHFDDNALDLSGSGNHGTENNSPTYESGKVNQGIKLDGVNQYVSTTQEAIGTQDFWISFWIKPDLATRHDGLIGIGNSASASGNGWSINYRGDIANDPLGLTFNDGNVTALIYTFSPAVGDLTGVFNHIVVNFDRNGLASIYLNNEFIDSVDISGYTGSLTGTAMNIGRQGTHSTYTDGIVDEVNYGIGRILSISEVTELYNNPANTNLNQPTFPSGAVGEWDLNGDSKDTSGNGNDGTDTSISYVQGRKDNDAASFNGSSSFIEVYHNGTINFAEADKSVSMWAYRENTTGYQELFALSVGKTTTRQIALAFYSGQPYLGLWATAGGSWQFLGLTTSGSAPIDEWTHICLTIADDGADTASYKIYINGILDATFTDFSIDDNSPTYLTFGKRYDAEYLDGRLEQIKFFDKTLTEQEILALAEQTDPVKDNSGNGNDGYSIKPLSWVQGVAGKAVLTNGIDNYIKLSISSALFPADDFSLSVWHDTTDDTVISNLDSTTEVAGNILLTSTLGIIEFRYYTADNTYTNVISTAISDGKHLIIVTVTSGGNIVLYIDGVSINTDTAPTLTAISTYPTIGYQKSTDNYEKTFSDEIRIYNKVLSLEEAKGLYKLKTSVPTTKQLTTIISGGMIETGIIKSTNYVKGVSGSKFDLHTGYVETGQGIFRGDVEIGADDADRQLSLGSKGLLVKDGNGVIIHDLPDNPILTGFSSLGHLYYVDGGSDSTVYYSSSAPYRTWTTVTCNTFGSANIKGVLLSIELTGSGSGASPIASIIMRPKGSSWGTGSGLAPRLRRVDIGITLTWISMLGQITLPIGDNNQVEFYAEIIPNSSTHVVSISHLGVYI